jgi:outer membrane receptor protein involved in Fe transport
MTAALWIGLALAAADSPVQAGLSQPPSGGDATVQGLVVNGVRAQMETSIDRRSYAVANDLSAQTGSIADVLRNIPSVQVDAQGNPSLQGESNVTIMLDGRPSSQFSGQSLGAALQSMPADQIDRIEVMTNPPAEFQAQGKGGIINLITKKSKGVGRSGSVRIRTGDHDRAGLSANLGYNSEKLSLVADFAYQHIRRSEFGDLTQIGVDTATHQMIDTDDLARDHWIQEDWQAHAGADYDLDSRTRLSASARFTSTRYNTLYADQFVEADMSGEDRTGHEHDRINVGEASMTWRRTYGEDHDLTLFVGYRGYDRPYRRLDVSTPSLSNDSTTATQLVAWTDLSPRTTLTADYQRPWAGGRLKFGYDWEDAPKITSQDTGNASNGGPIVSDPHAHGAFLDVESENEAYVSYERAVGKLTLLAGVRGEDVRLELEQRALGKITHNAYPRLYPNLHVAYDLGSGRQLTASLSRRTNVPYSEMLDPLPLSQSPLYLTAGNPDLRPEDAYAYELAYEKRQGDRTATMTLYYRETRDAFSTVLTQEPNQVTLQTTVNAGDIRRAGGEWAVSGKLTPKLSYNLSLDAYWTELSAANLGLLEARSATAGFGRASLNWQVTPKDLLQLNLFSTARRLLPQGYEAPSYSGNVGFRHTINNKASWLLALNDPFHTQRTLTTNLLEGVVNRDLRVPAARSISLTFVWNFAGKPKDAGFDFGGGGDGR